MTIPALSMWQPWASLLFARRKRHETRGRPFPAKHKGRRIAIHAAAAYPSRRHISPALDQLCVDVFGPDWRATLPRGAFLGTVQLVAAFPTEEREPASEADRVAGDWTAGRYAWEVDAPIPLPVPLAGRGRQSWFSVELGA